eukprot:TRINITY_DN913_c0_g1_i1.p1 TRINITY_DN913_c0_g1~~TRINITY_DN913_c0_g1_i1.p1  ORF type:complete len:1066 (-),score=175.95 TRINITY_DN913_c0_g1_i1:100-3297(-)
MAPIRFLSFVLLFSATLAATPASIDWSYPSFATNGDLTSIRNYYNGGTNQVGDSGTNYGITFSTSLTSSTNVDAFKAARLNNTNNLTVPPPNNNLFGLRPEQSGFITVADGFNYFSTYIAIATGKTATIKLLDSNQGVIETFTLSVPNPCPSPNVKSSCGWIKIEASQPLARPGKYIQFILNTMTTVPYYFFGTMYFSATTLPNNPEALPNKIDWSYDSTADRVGIVDYYVNGWNSGGDRRQYNYGITGSVATVVYLVKLFGSYSNLYIPLPTRVPFALAPGIGQGQISTVLNFNTGFTFLNTYVGAATPTTLEFYSDVKATGTLIYTALVAQVQTRCSRATSGSGFVNVCSYDYFTHTFGVPVKSIKIIKREEDVNSLYKVTVFSEFVFNPATAITIVPPKTPESLDWKFTNSAPSVNTDSFYNNGKNSFNEVGYNYGISFLYNWPQSIRLTSALAQLPANSNVYAGKFESTATEVKSTIKFSDGFKYFRANFYKRKNFIIQIWANDQGISQAKRETPLFEKAITGNCETNNCGWELVSWSTNPLTQDIAHSVTIIFPAAGEHTYLSTMVLPVCSGNGEEVTIDSVKYCSCYSGFGGVECQTVHSGLSPAQVQTSTIQFSPLLNIDLSGTKPKITVTIPAEISKVNKMTSLSYSTINLLKFTGKNNNNCDYPKRQDWTLTSSNNVNSYELNPTWNELIACAFQSPTKIGNYRFYYGSLLIQRDYYISTGKFSTKRTASISKNFAISFPEVVGSSSTIKVSNNTVDAFGSFSDIKFDFLAGTGGSWIFKLQTIISPPYRLTFQTSYSKVITDGRNFVYEPNTVSEQCTTASDGCIQIYNFKIEGCNQVSFGNDGFEMIFNVVCITGAVDCVAPQTPTVKLNLKADTSRGCPVDAQYLIKKEETHLTTYSDLSRTQTSDLFGFSETIYFAIDFPSPPASIQSISVASVCAYGVPQTEPTTIVPCITSLSTAQIKSPSTADARFKITFHANAEDLKKLSGVKESNDIIVQVDLSIEYTGSFAKRSVVMNNGGKAVISIPNDESSIFSNSNQLRVLFTLIFTLTLLMI